MKNVMLVDDNPISVEGMLKNINWDLLGAQVVACEYDANSALKVLDETPIDLIISDIEMPKLTGLELATRALEKNSFVKIILVSAYDKFEYAKQAVRIGVYDFIEKPLDYDYLRQKVKKALALIDKEQSNLELIENSRPAMIDSFFRYLINSYSDEARYYLSKYPNYLNLDLDCHFYCVITFDIENAANIKSTLGIPKYHLELVNLQDYMKELCSSLNLCYVLNDLRGLVCILGANCSHQVHFKKIIYDIITKIDNKYTDTLLHINIGIGVIIKYLWDMNHSYQSAVRALEYRFFFPQQNIFDAGDVTGFRMSKSLFSDEKEEKLIQLICKRNSSEISSWIKKFSEEILANYQTKSLLFIRVYSVLGRILKFLYEMDVDSSDIEKEIIHAYSTLESFTTSSDIFDWLDSLCQKVCMKLVDSTKTYHRQICDSVQKYIAQHYENNKLCLNDIAEYVNVSPTHLSALYRKSTGQTISDTITTVRIDAACKLLLQSTFPLKVISEKVGYTNQYYFSYCFKKKLGMTPSEYRANSKSPHN